MTDGVLTTLAQAVPVGGAVITVLVLLLRRESTSHISGTEREKAWREREIELKAEIRSNEKTIDAEMEKRRKVEDEFAQYRRDHP